MKRMMIWPAMALFALTVPVFSAQRNDRSDRISEDRPRAGDRAADRARDRASDRSAVQGDVPRNVLDAVHRRYPDAKVQLIDIDRGDVTSYHLRIETDEGQTTARATENGDFVFLGYPAANVRTLPPPVTAVLESLFHDQPRSAEKLERTSYVVDADFGNRSYQIAFDPLGRVGPMQSMREVREEDPSSYPRASREDEDRLMPGLRQYFPDPRVKSVHRYPDAEGYFWVNLSSSTDDDVWVLMNTQRDVSEYRIRLDRNRLPQVVQARLQEMFKNAVVRSIYRQERIMYEIVQPAGRNDTVVMNISPTGEVLRVRPGADRLDLDRDSGRDRQDDRGNLRLR